MRMLAICQVDRPGAHETALLSLVDVLSGEHQWQVTVTSPGAEMPDGSGLHVADHCQHWEPLDVGGLAEGAGARAVAAWPRAWRLAHAHDLIYINGSVAARLMPALRSRPTVLHIHHRPRRVTRHWLTADVVIADDMKAAARLRPLAVHIVTPPTAQREQIDAYAAQILPLLKHAVDAHDQSRIGSEGLADPPTAPPLTLPPPN